MCHQDPLRDRTVWCAVSSSQIVDPIFFETTVNTEGYLNIFEQFYAQLTPEEREYAFFQQDGATYVSVDGEVLGVSPGGSRSCEQLSLLRPRPEPGPYSLGQRELNPTGRDFYTRYCDTSAAGGGWTVIQRRGSYRGSRQNFTLPWVEYKGGFGQLEQEFWFGNDFIHRLTSEREVELRVELEAFNGSTAWAQYNTFRVDSEEHGYRLSVGGYSGNATDSLSEHNNKPFSTVDRTNDEAPPCCPCAPAYGGGWWFYSCFESNLNGVYYSPGDEPSRDSYRGLIWEHWLGDHSLRASMMMVRDRDYGFDDTIIPEDP
uniref:Fibrinogen C-terminal domain-containing protein n=1 Tax=Timema monikensis TaxID=170555 RepID=A0A7R9HMR7_9NEOP|nr:unnamed protein product [Timema monikensis]